MRRRETNSQREREREREITWIGCCAEVSLIIRLFVAQPCLQAFFISVEDKVCDCECECESVKRERERVEME